ncbi:MAG: methyltransferase domain-containing protein [Vulcanimicrobiaceae bacterium]
MKPFVDYYREAGISPVKQDVSNLGRHYAGRDGLYRHLGIPALCFRGAEVIEFGPGSGHNALFVASMNPSRYVLVEANPHGVREMRALFAEQNVRANIEIAETLVEDYATPDRFEFVLAEGLIPFSTTPHVLARKIATFAESGGVMVITCCDAASAMGEILRRFIARRFVELDRPRDERVRLLTQIFEPHLRTLEAATRSAEDWVLDNIVHPFTGELFGIGEAIETLSADFDVYASSPHFFVDWRWYKRIPSGDGDYNKRAIRAYRRVVCNMLDYRSNLPPHDETLGIEVLRTCSEVYALMQRSEASGEDVGDELVRHLDELRGLTQEIAPATAAAFASARTFLRSARPDAATLAHFEPFFGRGMQYLSLIRRPGYR